MNQDEAANAWNAYCLLKTGQDQFGVTWPVFYMRALGENRSTLFAYLMIPFQAVGGLSIWTTRLPAALGGLMTVLLIYWVGARSFCRTTGLLAAGLLAINPTHIQMTRWGHEASLTPLLTLLPFAALLWAGLPLGAPTRIPPARRGRAGWGSLRRRLDPPTASSLGERGVACGALCDEQHTPRPVRAVLAGLVTGICCYGYPAVRIFLPVVLVCCGLVTVRDWWRFLRAPHGGASVAGLVVGLAVTFGPLAYLHITEPEQIGRRAQNTWVWSESDGWATRSRKVAQRYVEHFGPRYLFFTGDEYEVVWARGFGFMPAYMLPCLIAGAAACGPRLRRSPAARVLVVAALLYPVGDSLNWHVSPNSLRSSAGLWPLMLLGAVGVRATLDFFTSRRLMVSIVAVGVAFGCLVAVQTERFLRNYFTGRASQWLAYNGGHVDLLAACDWLRPHLTEVDAVFCTPIESNQPYLITLVALGHDPRRWFAEPREWYPEVEWDRWVRYGKFHFMYEGERVAALQKLLADGRPKRAMFFLRASEPAPGEPVRRIVGPDGQTALVIYDVRLPGAAG